MSLPNSALGALEQDVIAPSQHCLIGPRLFILAKKSKSHFAALSRSVSPYGILAKKIRLLKILSLRPVMEFFLGVQRLVILG